MWPNVIEIQVLKCVNKLYFVQKLENVGKKTAKNVIFSKYGKWHDPKNKKIICKIERRTTCNLPDVQELK